MQNSGPYAAGQNGPFDVCIPEALVEKLRKNSRQSDGK